MHDGDYDDDHDYPLIRLLEGEDEGVEFDDDQNNNQDNVQGNDQGNGEYNGQDNYKDNNQDNEHDDDHHPLIRLLECEDEGVDISQVVFEEVH